MSVCSPLSPHIVTNRTYTPPFDVHYHRGNPDNHIIKVVDSKGQDVPSIEWNLVREMACK